MFRECSLYSSHSLEYVCIYGVNKLLNGSFTLINVIKLMVALSITALVFSEYFLVPNGVRKLNFAYKEAIAYLERRLYVKIDYAPFRRTFQWKVQMVVFVFLLIFTIKILLCITYEDIDRGEIAQFFIHYLKQLALMHILFHIEFVRFVMQIINMEFNPISKQLEFTAKPIQPKTFESLLTLCHCKHIHFRIWKIFRILNIRFGWILIVLLLALMLDISYSSYWIWVNIHVSSYEHITPSRIMRKYIVHLYMCICVYFCF